MPTKAVGPVLPATLAGAAIFCGRAIGVTSGGADPASPQHAISPPALRAHRSASDKAKARVGPGRPSTRLGGSGKWAGASHQQATVPSDCTAQGAVSVRTNPRPVTRHGCRGASQHHTSPEWRRAQSCPAPSEIWATSVSHEIVVGEVDRREDETRLQHDTLPERCSTQVRSSRAWTATASVVASTAEPGAPLKSQHSTAPREVRAQACARPTVISWADSTPTIRCRSATPGCQHSTWPSTTRQPRRPPARVSTAPGSRGGAPQANKIASVVSGVLRIMR